MTDIFNLLENPIVQLFLITGAGMGLTWLSEREEARRVSLGLPRRSLRERALQGLGFLVAAPPVLPEKEDIWVTAARELELPLDKVLLLKERVMTEKEKQVRSAPKKQAVS